MQSSLRDKTERDKLKINIGLHVQYPLFLSDFETWSFSTEFRKMLNLWNFIKIRLVGAELFHEDRQTNRQTTWQN